MPARSTAPGLLVQWVATSPERISDLPRLEDPGFEGAAVRRRDRQGTERTERADAPKGNRGDVSVIPAEMPASP